MSDFPPISDAPGAGVLAIAIIGPDEKRRVEVANALTGFPGAAITEFSSFPTTLDVLPVMLKKHFDVVFIDLDSDPNYAFDVVECICAYGTTSVMVYSAQSDLKLAIRFMRAGAREFLTLPLGRADIAGALARATVRGPGARPARKTARKLFVFLGSKGGCGVTTIASNFAVALAQESGQSTLLIDLGLPLGDAAINLGMVAEYSTLHALQDANRLDANFLSSLLSRHSSGLFVLAAPGELPKSEPPLEATDKLLAVARQSFDYVVVDAGSRLDLRQTALFEEPAIVYLVTQVGVSELRNSNRMISRFFAARGRSLQIVINRYMPHALLFDERHIARALTRPAQWRIPDDYASARRTQNTATPLVLEDSPISAVIRKMARTACGLPAEREKKGGFSHFIRDVWPFSKSSRHENESAEQYP
jgi:pilus assembly protein CpaE